MEDNCSNGNNVTWFNGFVTREDREKLHGHKGAVIWFTGLSASGKSTVAHLVEKELHRSGCSTMSFDGDNVRHGLCADLRFSATDRKENIRRIGEMVKLFVDAGVIVVTAFISPFREDRQKIRDALGEGQYMEVYMNCPVEVCAARDKKGIYEKARAGIIKDFTGISSPYEAPENPDLEIDSARENVIEATKKVMALVRTKGILFEKDCDPT